MRELFSARVSHQHDAPAIAIAARLTGLLYSSKHAVLYATSSADDKCIAGQFNYRELRPAVHRDPWRRSSVYRGLRLLLPKFRLAELAVILSET